MRRYFTPPRAFWAFDSPTKQDITTMTDEPNDPSTSSASTPPEIPSAAPTPVSPSYRAPVPAAPTPEPAQSPGYEELDGGFGLANILNKLLRKPLSLIYTLEMTEEGSKLPPRLLAITAISLAIFGLVVGSFSAGAQLWAAPVKIVGGVLFSALICLPSLYIFACLGGLDAKFRTVAGLLCTLVALTSLLLVGFAPVVWLFSVSSDSLAFMGFLLVILWLLCVGFGLLLVHRGGRVLGMTNTRHLFVWCTVFLLVTLQMPTTLRPIVGKSDTVLNLEEKRFFLSYWGEQIADSTP